MKTEFPRALHVKALKPYRLRIRWSTGETLEVDIIDYLRRNRSLKHVLDPAVFKRAHAGEHGTSIEWKDSELGADNVYAWTREQMGEASHEMFYGWMLKNGLTMESAAQALGMSRRMISYYRSGSRQIPKHVWLACIGYEHTHKQQAA